MKRLVAANWKMHKSPIEVRSFFKKWDEISANINSAKVDIAFFPSTVCLGAISEISEASALNTKCIWQWGAQNCHFEDKGAFTGETSPSVLQQMGASWCLVGHSERRTLFGEHNDFLSKKVQKIQMLKMTPIFCFGETLEQRKAGQTLAVLEEQLTQGLKLADRNQNLVLAYEPVWAIGTGVVATAEQVAEVHKFLEKMRISLGFSDQVRFLYGGSVKADNAAELIALPHVHGFLVGGASLEVETFWPIVKAAQE